MNNKTIKTILFASLIAAMVLPFSGMNYAEAEEQTDDLAKLVDYKKELKKQLTKTENESEKKEIKLILKRVKIVIALLQIQQNPQITTSNQEDNQNIEYLMNALNTTFDESESQMIKSGSGAFTASGTTNYQTTTQSKFNCETISTQYGYNWGTVTGIDFIESYVVAVQGYPSSIAIMENNYCTEKNFDNGYVKYRNISTGGMCTGTLDNANSVDQGYCAKFGTGNPVLITATAWYDGFNPFNTTEGYKFIWVP